MNNEEVKVEGPLGTRVSFKGPQLFPTALVLLLSAVFTYLFFQSDAKADLRAKDTITAIQAMTSSNIKTEATQRAMIYVLSLTQDERQRLNLLKPKELSEMQR